MEVKTFETTVITAAPGMYLTQSATDIPDEQRVVTSQVYLGAGGSPDDWQEIGVEEAELVASLSNQSFDKDITVDATEDPAYPYGADGEPDDAPADDEPSDDLDL